MKEKGERGPFRILYLQKFPSLGGSQQSLWLSLQALRSSYGIEPMVVVKEEGWLTQKLHEAGIPYALASFTHWNLTKILHNLRLARKIAQLALQFRASVLHANEHWIGPIGWWAARRIGRPSLCHFRTGLADLTPRRIRKYRLPRFDAVVAVAEVLAQRLREYSPPEKIHVIRNPIQVPDRPSPTPQTPKQIAVCIGAIDPIKGQQKVLEAATPWLAQSPTHLLLFVGYTDRAPNYVAQMRQWIETHRLQRQVLFLGPREDVPRLLQNALALIAYSEIEGVPRVVMEAMAHGRPCIVSNTPGMDEVVEEGKTGYRVDFQKSLTQVSELLARLSADSDLWHQMSRRAWERAHQLFRPETVASQLFSLYQRLLSWNEEKGKGSPIRSS